MSDGDRVRCKCGAIGLDRRLWKEFGPDILDRRGMHSEMMCLAWPELPEEQSAICKRLAGTLKDGK